MTFVPLSFSLLVPLSLSSPHCSYLCPSLPLTARTSVPLSFSLLVPLSFSLLVGHRSGNVVPTSGNLLPEHDYDDVAFEEEESNKEGQVKLRHLSKLTPPVESTYSIIGEDQIIFTEPDDEQYSHLHGVDTKVESTSTEDPIGYSLLSGPLKTTINDSNYSTLSDVSDTPKPSDKPPLFPDRPRTTYEQGMKGHHSSLTSPRFTVDDDTVSRQKFDIIMEQLRKVQVIINN